VGRLCFCRVGHRGRNGMTWADGLGHHAHAYNTSSPVSVVMALSLFLIVTAGCLSIATKSLNDALASARSSNRELQASRASLEQRVAERTAELTTAKEAAESAREEADKARQDTEAANQSLAAQMWQTAGKRR